MWVLNTAAAWRSVFETGTTVPATLDSGFVDVVSGKFKVQSQSAATTARPEATFGR
jgi:hypothetical protein